MRWPEADKKCGGVGAKGPHHSQPPLLYPSYPSPDTETINRLPLHGLKTGPSRPKANLLSPGFGKPNKIIEKSKKIKKEDVHRSHRKYKKVLERNKANNPIWGLQVYFYRQLKKRERAKAP